MSLGLCAAAVLHALSLLSSSFVEEEHQTWYFLTVTFWLVIAVHLMIRRLQLINMFCSGQNAAEMVDNKQPSSGPLQCCMLAFIY